MSEDNPLQDFLEEKIEELVKDLPRGPAWAIPGNDEDLLPFFEPLNLHLKSAREKHPVFATSKQEAVSILLEEVGEVARAVNEKDDEGLVSELFDVVTVCLRWLQKGV